jgi:hypothetical protein
VYLFKVYEVLLFGRGDISIILAILKRILVPLNFLKNNSKDTNHFDGYPTVKWFFEKVRVLEKS